MNATEIINGCQRDGILLNLTNDGMIRYAGDEYSLRYWLPILAKHRSAVVEELSTDPFAPNIEMIRCCKECRHFATPGLSAGYCGQREDLPPAYGINHPLKRLPSDNGATCSEWELSEFCQFEQHNPKE